MSSKSRVLVLFSGGKDSFLTTCILAKAGHKISLVTFENTAGLACHNVKHGTERIIKKYGSESVDFLGIYSIAGIWRQFLLPFLNEKPKDILVKYGNLSYSQFNCLTCRSAMYVVAISLARQMKIGTIADGGRISQGFVIELPPMIKQYSHFFKCHKKKLIFPVLDLSSDWKRKNELLVKGFVPKTLEPQCLLGAPLPNEKTPDKEEQSAIVKYFKTEILPNANKMLANNIQLDTIGGKYI